MLPALQELLDGVAKDDLALINGGVERQRLDTGVRVQTFGSEQALRDGADRSVRLNELVENGQAVGTEEDSR